MRGRAWILCAVVSAAAAVTPTTQGTTGQVSSQEKPVPSSREAMDGEGGSDRTTAAATGKDSVVMQAVELASYIAVIVASVVAILGIGAWRREFKGKRDIEPAEDVLCLFYRAERAIVAVRCPGSYSSEEQGRALSPNETPEQSEARDRAHVVFKRIQNHGEIFDQLYALRFRFMARFGRDTATSFDRMRDIIIEIQVSAGCLAQLWADRLRRGDQTSPGTERQIEKHESVIWPMGAEDQIGPRVANIMTEIEIVCRPIIEGRISWFSRLWRKAFAGKEAAKP